MAWSAKQNESSRERHGTELQLAVLAKTHSAPTRGQCHSAKHSTNALRKELAQSLLHLEWCILAAAGRAATEWTAVSETVRRQQGLCIGDSSMQRAAAFISSSEKLGYMFPPIKCNSREVARLHTAHP